MVAVVAMVGGGELSVRRFPVIPLWLVGAERVHCGFGVEGSGAFFFFFIGFA